MSFNARFLIHELDLINLPNHEKLQKSADRKARKGRNPQTGEAIKIKASNAVKFKAGKKLRDSV